MVHRTTGEKNVFFGIITNISILGKNDYKNNILFEAKSETIRLDGKPSLNSFCDLDLHNIVKESVETYSNGAKININPKFDRRIEYVSMWEESCFSFLNRLSSLYGEAFYSDNGLNIFFGLPMLDDAIPIIYDAEITSMLIEANLHPAKFRKYDYLTSEDKELVSETRDDFPKTYGYQKVVSDKSNEIFHSTSIQNQQSFVDMGNTFLNQVDLEKARDIADMLILKGMSQTCKVGIGRVIRIDYSKGMNIDTTAGDFLVTKVVHPVNEEGHYSNSFSGVRAALEQIPVKDVVYPNVSSQRAIVVDNKDSDGVGRIKVVFQWQKDIQKTTNWIRVLTPDGGGTDKVLKNRGFAFIPEIGDEVMINFENNDPNKPYCSGSLYSVNKGEGGGGNNHRKSIMTRSGIRIVFNDDAGSLHIEDPSGNTWDMDGNGNIKVFAPKNINLAAGNNTHLSASNDLTMSVGNGLTTNVDSRGLFNIMQSTQINTNMMRQLITQSYFLQSSKSMFKIDEEMKIESKEAYVSDAKKLFLHSDTAAILNSKGVASMKGDTKNTFDNVGEVYEAAANEITAKVIVHFRPKADWKGDFGFDWMRMSDTDWMGGTKMFGDSKPYEEIVAKQYDDAAYTILTTDINEFNGKWKLAPTLYENLKTKYKLKFY